MHYQRPHWSRDEKYRHVVHVEMPRTSSSQQEVRVSAKVNGCKPVAMEGMPLQPSKVQSLFI